MTHEQDSSNEVLLLLKLIFFCFIRYTYVLLEIGLHWIGLDWIVVEIHLLYDDWNGTLNLYIYFVRQN